MPENWKQPFQLGVKAFRESNHEDAIKHFSRSIELDGTNASVFDSRAAAYQCLGKLREGLGDTKRCIGLQPDRYVGYYRSARIFLAMAKYDRCIHMLGEARKRLNPSDASYTRKTSEMDEMEANARDGIHRVEAFRRNHVDPLKALPLELLVEICKIAVDVSDDEVGPRGASHFAVVLGSVCRSLRDLVRASPVLWRSVTFSERRFAKKRAFWKERSAGSPMYSLALVDVDFYMSDVEKFLAEEPLGSLKRLHIEGTQRAVHKIYNFVRTFDLQLHSISLLCPDFQGQSHHGTFFRTTMLTDTMAPVPETIEPGMFVRRISVQAQLLCLDSSFAGITHLQLNIGSLLKTQYDFVYQALCSLPRLTGLDVQLHSPPLVLSKMRIPAIPELEGSEPLQANQLEVLRLSQIGPETTRTLFLPRLQVFDLHRTNTNSVNIMLGHLLTEQAPQTYPPVREIRLHTVCFTCSTLKLILAVYTPTLESLEISYCEGLDNEVVEGLSRPVSSSNHPLCCPRLQDVNFSGNGDLNAGPLVRLVKARLPRNNADHPNPPIPIRSLVIDHCPGIDSEVLPWMRANVNRVSCVYKTKEEAKGRRRDRFL